MRNERRYVVLILTDCYVYKIVNCEFDGRFDPWPARACQSSKMLEYTSVKNFWFEITSFQRWKIFFKTFLLQYHVSLKLVAIPNLGKTSSLDEVEVNRILKVHQVEEAELIVEIQIWYC